MSPMKRDSERFGEGVYWPDDATPQTGYTPVLIPDPVEVGKFMAVWSPGSALGGRWVHMTNGDVDNPGLVFVLDDNGAPGTLDFWVEG